MQDQGFAAAWFAEYTDSKLRAFFEAAVMLGAAIYGWFEWASKPATTPAQVMIWMGCLMVWVVAVVFFHARSVWQRTTSEVASLGVELAALKAKKPSPSLVLTYASPSIYGSKLQIPAAPLVIHNQGPAGALEVVFQSVQFNPDLVLEIDRIDFIGPYASQELRVHLMQRDQDGGFILDKPEHLGYAVSQANTHHAWASTSVEELQAGRLLWPLRFSYIDEHLNRYEREYSIELSRGTMKASVVFKR